MKLMGRYGFIENHHRGVDLFYVVKSYQESSLEEIRLVAGRVNLKLSRARL
jgi:hypothetical protein